MLLQQAALSSPVIIVLLPSVLATIMASQFALQVDRVPNIDARNASGDTIRELAATAAAHASG